MRIYLFSIIIFLLQMNSFAGHVGCVTFNDKSLCETEDAFHFKSDEVRWEMLKDQFKEKLLVYLERLIPGHSVRMGTVFLWVNDFNTSSSLRIQIWQLGQSFILDMPTDLNNINIETDLSLRTAGPIPYPIDFGYTLGEIIIQCHNDCSAEHTEWLGAGGVVNTKVLLPKILLAYVPFFNEEKIIQTLKIKSGFEKLFQSVELSPVIEGNGFRELAFTIYF